MAGQDGEAGIGPPWFIPKHTLSRTWLDPRQPRAQTGSAFPVVVVYRFPEVPVYDYGDDYDRRFERDQDPVDLRHICLEPVVLDRNPGPDQLPRITAETAGSRGLGPVVLDRTGRCSRHVAVVDRSPPATSSRASCRTSSVRFPAGRAGSFSRLVSGEPGEGGSPAGAGRSAVSNASCRVLGIVGRRQFLARLYRRHTRLVPQRTFRRQTR